MYLACVGWICVCFSRGNHFACVRIHGEHLSQPDFEASNMRGENMQGRNKQPLWNANKHHWHKNAFLCWTHHKEAT